MLFEQTHLQIILDDYAGRGREALLPVLWDVQTAHGHISAAAVREISHALRVPEADIYGVIGFYTLFHAEPTGKQIVRVCTSPSCGLAGSKDVLGKLCEHLDVEPGETTEDGAYTVEATECLGMCDRSPSMLVSERQQGEALYGPVHDPVAFLKNPNAHDYTSEADADPAVLLDGTEADALDYPALHDALENLTPEDIIERVEASGLVGRGGAAFPTGLKWKFTRGAGGDEKYIVCNADESEPGTFKDRHLMEHYPHKVLEGMILAAYAVGASEGYIFVRGEYPRATAVMEQAIAEAERAGLLGAGILGREFDFHVTVRRGAGAYICGEETALFEAIEGKRGFPRIKPPYPTTVGLFGKPTAANNVETLCNVPRIVQHGAADFREYGTDDSTGTKLVSVSGHVAQPLVYEIEPGITLRELLEDRCGGVVGELQAVLMGGAAGTFLTPDEIDVKLTFEDLRAAGTTFGSGAIMVFNETVDLRDVLADLGHFFQHESCGKCFPCQLGTQRQVEILDRLHTPVSGDTVRLQDIGHTMTESSLCGLGQTAATAVLSAMQKFPHLFPDAT